MKGVRTCRPLVLVAVEKADRALLVPDGNELPPTLLGTCRPELDVSAADDEGEQKRVRERDAPCEKASANGGAKWRRWWIDGSRATSASLLDTIVWSQGRIDTARGRASASRHGRALRRRSKKERERDARRVAPARKPNSLLRMASNAPNCCPSAANVGSMRSLPSLSPVPYVPTSCAEPNSAHACAPRRDGTESCEATRLRLVRPGAGSPSSSLPASLSSSSPSWAHAPSSTRTGLVLDASLSGGASEPNTLGASAAADSVGLLVGGASGAGGVEWKKRESARLVWRYVVEGEGRLAEEEDDEADWRERLVRSAAKRGGVALCAGAMRACAEGSRTVRVGDREGERSEGRPGRSERDASTSRACSGRSRSLSLLLCSGSAVQALLSSCAKLIS